MDAYEQGFNLFKTEPELALAEVWWHPQCPKDFPNSLEFIEGYKAARRQRDEFLRDQREPA